MSWSLLHWELTEEEKDIILSYSTQFIFCSPLKVQCSVLSHSLLNMRKWSFREDSEHGLIVWWFWHECHHHDSYSFCPPMGSFFSAQRLRGQFIMVRIYTGGTLVGLLTERSHQSPWLTQYFFRKWHLKMRFPRNNIFHCKGCAFFDNLPEQK